MGNKKLASMRLDGFSMFAFGRQMLNALPEYFLLVTLSVHLILSAPTDYAAQRRLNSPTTSSSDPLQEAGEVCYEPLGCFSLREPWRYALRPVPAPWPPTRVNTRFFLCSRFDTNGQLVGAGAKMTVGGAALAMQKYTFFIVHDFATDTYAPWAIKLKDAILEKVPGNVFLVDWAAGAAADLSYLQVVSNARIAGAEIARLLKDLIADYNIKRENIHLIGLGVGAHVAAYAGNQVKELGRLTALDPAQAAFEDFERIVRVDADDAVFVEAVHSDARPAIPHLGTGMLLDVGDVDFYINGGVEQPGCPWPNKLPVVKKLEDFSKITAGAYYNLSNCPHARAADVYIEAIQMLNCTFWGHPGEIMEADPEDIEVGRPFSHVSQLFEDCSVQNCAPLGLDAVTYPARGSLVVSTAIQSPYCVEEDITDRMRESLKQFQDNMKKNVFASPTKKSFTDAKVAPFSLLPAKTSLATTFLSNPQSSSSHSRQTDSSILRNSSPEISVPPTSSQSFSFLSKLTMVSTVGTDSVKVSHPGIVPDTILALKPSLQHISMHPMALTPKVETFLHKMSSKKIILHHERKLQSKMSLKDIKSTQSFVMTPMSKFKLATLTPLQAATASLSLRKISHSVMLSLSPPSLNRNVSSDKNLIKSVSKSPSTDVSSPSSKKVLRTNSSPRSAIPSLLFSSSVRKSSSSALTRNNVPPGFTDVTSTTKLPSTSASLAEVNKFGSFSSILPNSYFLASTSPHLTARRPVSFTSLLSTKGLSSTIHLQHAVSQLNSRVILMPNLTPYTQRQVYVNSSTHTGNTHRFVTLPLSSTRVPNMSGVLRSYTTAQTLSVKAGLFRRNLESVISWRKNKLSSQPQQTYLHKNSRMYSQPPYTKTVYKPKSLLSHPLKFRSSIYSAGVPTHPVKDISDEENPSVLGTSTIPINSIMFPRPSLTDPLFWKLPSATILKSNQHCNCSFLVKLLRLPKSDAAKQKVNQRDYT